MKEPRNEEEPDDIRKWRNWGMHHIVQSVIGEIDYVGSNRDDEVWWQLHALQEADDLPGGLTADELYNLYRSNYGDGV